ncbi:MAG: GAF domain-containing protein [Bacteroidia bacterium]
MNKAVLSEEKISPAEKFGGVVDIFKLFSLPDFPYATQISFEPLIEFWKARRQSRNQLEGMVADNIFDLLGENHELNQPFTDIEKLNQYPCLVEMLTSVFLPVVGDNKLIRFTGPFNTHPFYHSSALSNFLKRALPDISMNKSPERVRQFLVVRAGCIILRTFYHMDKLALVQPYTFSLTDPQTGLQFHLQSNIDDRFVTVIKKKRLKKLTSDHINALLSDVFNTDLWLKYLPPENFEFQGVICTELQDISESEILSRLKYRLLKPDAIVSRSKVSQLEHQLRSFFREPELRLGIFAIDYPTIDKPADQYEISHGFLSDEYPYLFTRKNQDSIYEQACISGELLLIEDLTKHLSPTRLEKALLRQGLRSMLVVPIYGSRKKIIGIMELGSPMPYGLNSFTLLKLKQIIPLIKLAVNRSRDEIDNQIEAIIRDKYTALHPSVEWRFLENASRALHQENSVVPGEDEKIIFEDVYPLYGQADIVGSTKLRNKAVQADLIQNLYLVKKYLGIFRKYIDFPLAEKLEIETDLYSASIKRQVTASNEFQITEFITQEVHPVFRAFRKKARSLRLEYQQYFSKLYPGLGVIYEKRKEFDDSVFMLNEMISNFLEREDEKAQNMIPHYYEKFKTDGISYNMYVGQSILQKGKFKFLHLQNLRLWQLIKMCEITRLAAQLKPRLAVPFDTAQLILVHSGPIAIEFRMDEKRFDVEGTYNVQYEITKKRVDKAIIEGTNERLTTAGKIAIVFQRERNRQEYLRYFDFLIKKGLITNNIEEFALKRMQGLQGLRALRITPKV